MDKTNVSSYYLVVEARPREFMPIDINILAGTTGMDYSSIEAIDAFTKRFTIDEIRDLIIENNLLPENFLNGTICIINERSFRFKVFTKDSSLSLNDYARDNISDKRLMNKLFNIFLKYVNEPELINQLRTFIGMQNADGVLSVLSFLDYNVIRNIYFYIENTMKEDKEDKRVLKTD